MSKKRFSILDGNTDNEPYLLYDKRAGIYISCSLEDLKALHELILAEIEYNWHKSILDEVREEIENGKFSHKG